MTVLLPDHPATVESVAGNLMMMKSAFVRAADGIADRRGVLLAPNPAQT